MEVQRKSRASLKQYRQKRNRRWEEVENFKNIIKSTGYERL